MTPLGRAELDLIKAKAWRAKRSAQSSREAGF